MTTLYARLKDFSNILHLNQMKFVVYDLKYFGSQLVKYNYSLQKWKNIAYFEKHAMIQINGI